MDETAAGIRSLNEGGLAGIRVIDFGQYIAGPLAAMLLADCGAEVIRVDPPTGPRWKHPANAILQRNKRSIVLDLHRDNDRETAQALVDSADVVIEGFRPGVMARLGLSPAACRSRNPGLVWCSLPGFGHDDSRAQLQGWEGIICAAAGLYPATAFATTGSPRFSPLPHASNYAALIAAHSIVAALIGRDRSGRGDEIEVPLFDAAFEAQGMCAESPMSTDLSLGASTGCANPAIGDSSLYRAGDGRFVKRGMPARGFVKFWDAHLPAELKDKTDEESVQRAAKLLTELFPAKDAVEWERIGQVEYGAALATHQSTEDWLRDDHAVDSQTVVHLVDPELGPMNQAGLAFNMSDTPVAVRSARRPLDDDGASVRDELANIRKGDVPIRGPSEGNGPRRMPLAGIRVIDFSMLLAGPGACRILAEYGAEVVKVNKAAVGWGDIDHMSDDGITFIGHRTVNGGKQTMFLDLKDEEGRRIAQSLIKGADVVHHNFTPDAAGRLGLGEDQLRAGREDLIYSKVSLHARGGWREHFRGHEDHSQALTGQSIRFGSSDAPELAAVLISDNGTGHMSAIALLVALFHRGRTGKGQRVDASLTQSATIQQLPFMLAFEGQRWDEPSGPHATGWSRFDRLYEAADGWFYLVAPSEEARASLLALASVQEPAVPDDAALEARLSERFREGQVDDWVQRLQAIGVVAHVYRDMDALWKDPVVASRKLIVEEDHPGLGRGCEIGIIARFESMPQRHIAPAARPGWHTRAILGELGYDNNAIDDLLKSRVIAEASPEHLPMAFPRNPLRILG